MKTSLLEPMLNHPTNRLLLFLVCILSLPCWAADPAANLTGHVVRTDACGDGASSAALQQRILRAIQQEVMRRTAPDTVMVGDQDLQIQACPPQALADSDLLIKQAEYDVARDVTVFWLVSAKSGNVLPPLMVTVHKQRSMPMMVAKRDLRGGEAVSMNDFVAATQSSGNILLPASRLWAAIPSPISSDPAPKKPAIKATPNPVLLVKVGIPAELIVLGKNFKGGMTVIPLESGGRGDELRVRDPGTRNVLRARVTSVNQLEQIF